MPKPDRLDSSVPGANPTPFAVGTIGHCRHAPRGNAAR